MADVHGTPASRSASWHILFHDGVPRELTQSRGGDLRDLPKHRSSCSTVEEDLAAATAMDGSTLPVVTAESIGSAISKTPRAAGYRGSDFVRWHLATRSLAAVTASTLTADVVVNDVHAAGNAPTLKSELDGPSSPSIHPMQDLIETTRFLQEAPAQRENSLRLVGFSSMLRCKGAGRHGHAI